MGKGSAMKCYCTIQLPHARPTMHCIPLNCLVLQATLPGAKKPPCVASTFLGKYTSITAVDLIQRKKLGSQKFFESNLAEARFEII